VPVRQPTSCAFAGPGLARLTVTKAREGLEELEPGASDGSVLVVDGLQATGLAPHHFVG
jgi:sugar lactone lactonase YvrE